MYYKLKNHDILYNDAQLGPYPDHLLKRVDKPTNMVGTPKRKYQKDTVNTVVANKARAGEYPEKLAKEILKRPVKLEPITQSFTEFMNPHLINLRDVHKPVNPEKAPLPNDLRAVTRHIKCFAYFLGADAVGICEVPDYAVYLDDSRGKMMGKDKIIFTTDDPHGNAFENPYKYGIVLLKRKNADTTLASTGRDRIFDACSHQVYQLLALWTHVLCKYIRKLGYDALASNNRNYVTVMTSMVIAAGLAESCRMGFALNPFFGANFKSACVLTNLPLMPDKPIDFGLKSYCDRCHICADVCPSGAISKDNEQVLYNGYMKYKIDYEKHILLGAVDPYTTSCGRCTDMCPWNRPESAPEYFRDWDGSIEALHAMVDKRADYLRAHNFVTEEQLHNQWWFDFMQEPDGDNYYIPKTAQFEIPPQEETPPDVIPLE